MDSVIHIEPMGYLANRMIQYLAANRLQAHWKGSRLSNVQLPEWGIETPAIETDASAAELVLRPDAPMPFRTVADLLNGSEFRRVVIAEYMQRTDYLGDAPSCARLFPPKAKGSPVADDELAIHIRAGDIVGGVGLYPLVPAEYYRMLIDLSGLKPCFMGQLDDSAHCEKLRRMFPEARFLEPQDVLSDFETIRSARHIAISVSTFSWLAAWLSSAENIFLPMLGFLNPMHRAGSSEIDLLPTSDVRYRFFLFPIYHGLPMAEALPLQARLTSYCREISPRQVDTLRLRAPYVQVAKADVEFNPIWYAHSYMDAAMEISEGWFAGPLEHYLEIGRRRGYRPLPPGFSQRRRPLSDGIGDVAAGKRCQQSSLSAWSVGRTTEEDAGRALSEWPEEPYAFHTDWEDSPWWRVDLGQPHEITEILVRNRADFDFVATRAGPLRAEISMDGENWIELFTTPPGLMSGSGDRPVIWTAPAPSRGCFVRIVVPRWTCLHLRQVQVFGRPAG